MMKMKFKLSIASIIFFLFSIPSLAQYSTLGNDPLRANWRQIKSEHYTLIYPQETDSIARRYLYLLEKWRPAVMEPLKISPKRIPVVLHPYSTLSNGMVAWAPKRMELYSTPDAYDGYPDIWDENLVIHESRHVGQCEHYTKGVWNVLYYILGEQSTGLALALYPGGLFLEGDATTAETELSKVGRGRRAEFLQYQRAASLNNDFRTWDQMRFGSHKYITPNKYVMGYLMQASMRINSEKYYFVGDFNNMLVKYWYNPKVFSRLYKSYTNKGRAFYVQDYQISLGKYWAEDLKSRGELTQGDKIREKTTRLYSDYTSPVPFYNNKTKELEIYARMSGVDYSQRMIRLDTTGNQSFVRYFNSISSRPVLSSDGKIYWTEMIKRQASTLEDYSVLRSYDPIKNKTKNYKWKTRYYNPAPSSTGDTIALAQYPIKGSSYLVFVDAKRGEELYKVEAYKKGQIKEIAYIGEDVYCSMVGESGLGIYKYSKGEWSEIVPQQYKTIKGMKTMGHYLYFTTDLDDLQNIYAYNLQNNKLSRLTNSEYGASDAHYDERSGDMYYAQYSHKGYDIVKKNIYELEWSPASFSKPKNTPWAEELSAQARKYTKLDTTQIAFNKESKDTYDLTKYPSKKYSRFTHAFRFHSWAPVYYNVDNIMSMSFENFYEAVSLGVTAYSQNTLGTAVTMLGYSYHKGFHAGHAKFSYSGLGPTIELSTDVNTRDVQTYKFISLMGQQYLKKAPDLEKVFVNTRVLIYYPLNLYSGGWQRGFIPQFAWNFNNDRFYSYKDKKDIFAHQLSYGARYYQMLPITQSGIFPRYGFGVSALGASVPFSGENFGSMYQLSTYFYLPGVIRNQGIKMTAEWQQQLSEGKNYYVGTYSAFPRGYNDVTPTELYLKATFDYAIPIYLGDVSLGPILYLKRLQLIPFADYAMDWNPRNEWEKHYSFGSDLLLDFFILRFDVPLSVGLRYARTGAQQGNRNHFQFLFKISLP